MNDMPNGYPFQDEHVSLLDTPIAVTFFKNFAASEKWEEHFSLRNLAVRIKSVTAATKAQLPWLKLATFGELRTDKKSLRHDSNLQAISGIEVDYDLGMMTVDEACERLEQAGIAAMVYTSPSHTEDAPRWRILCPTSVEMAGAARQHLVGRLNGLFNGILAGESFTLSQSYYFGSVNRNPSHTVRLIDGTAIDEHDDLDEIWTGKPNTKPSRTEDGPKASGPLDRQALLSAMMAGTNYHAAMTRLAGHFARYAVPYMDARQQLIDAMETVSIAQRDARWKSRRFDLDRVLGDIYGKQAAKRDAAEVNEKVDPGEDADASRWGNPDKTILRLARRAPPHFPIEAFGPAWARWIEAAAEAASAPPDYVGVPLLAAASSLIGHARWAEATPGWREPPHIWAGVVGDSGSSKSPGADCLLRDVLPEIEQRMLGDFPERLREWRAQAEASKAREETWQRDVKAAQKNGNAPPLPPDENLPAEPQAPRLRQSDVTIERVATLMASAAPKGLLIVRDELSGWLLGLNAYNDSGRAFWLEAYGGRPYRVERQKSPEPIVVPRLAVAVTGGTQPEKLSQMFRDADDGLLARFVWAWPDPLPFRLGRGAPESGWAIDALDRLRLLDLLQPEQPGLAPHPMMIPLAPGAVAMMEAFGREMQDMQVNSGGLMRSCYGKARGLALRLSLCLEMLRWCADAGMTPPPTEIGEPAFAAACDFVADYFMPSAERVYGDAAATQAERNAATLARWVAREKPEEVHVRRMQREVRLPGLTTAETIHAAAAVLVDADWLRVPDGSGTAGRPKASYLVNPALGAP